MLRTICTMFVFVLLWSRADTQQKIGDNPLTIDSASLLELESTSRGFLISRLTSTQRNAQASWKLGHIIYNTTDSCLQIYDGISWECLVQGTLIDSTIYKYDGTLTSDRTIQLNGRSITFDGSSDVYIGADGRMGLGTTTPDALLDVEGGTVRLSDYGAGTISGTPSFILGVDSDGDVIEISSSSVGTDDQTIDTLSFDGANVSISLEGDQQPAYILDISSVNTDNQQIDTLSLVGNQLRLSLQRDGLPFSSVDLSSLDTKLTQEEVEDFVGAMVSGNTETGITVTYDDPAGKLNFVATDASITNEGRLGVGAGAANTSTITSNTSGQTPVTITAGTGLSITEATSTNGGTITLTNTGDTDATDDITSLSAGTGISITGAGNSRTITNSSPDQTVSLTGAGSVSTSGTYPNFTITGTDNQQIDTLSLVGNQLRLSLQRDGLPFSSVDLSSLDTKLTQEEVEDFVGAMVSGNTETGITVTYDDPAGKLNFVATDASITNEGRLGVGAGAANTSTITSNTSGQTPVTITAGTGLSITEATSTNGGTITLTNSSPDQTVALTGAGGVSITGTYPSFTITGSTTVDSSIYKNNGSLLANRTVAMNGFSLTFDGTQDVIIAADGDVGIGTTSPQAKLDVDNGGLRLSDYGTGTTYLDTSAQRLLAVQADGDVVALNTVKNTRWFYAPAVTIDASATGTGLTLDLHQEYVDQFTNIPAAQRSPGAPASLPVYAEDELWYIISYYDATVISNISIDANGVLTYDIIDVPFDNYTIVNVQFFIK